jgi:hypothetical protein
MTAVIRQEVAVKLVCLYGCNNLVCDISVPIFDLKLNRSREK